MEKMKRIANNYAQIVSIGKASMLDMRQFAYAGIPIFEAVSKELNVSQQELRKMISDGKVTSDIIEKVFKDLTGINGIFENATEKGAKTLKARLQNLQDAKQLALSEVGDTIVKAGSSYGNDSIVLNVVQMAEGFFNWAKEHQDVKNIERDVNLIQKSDSRINALETMLEESQKGKDKDLERLIKAEIEYQKNVFTLEQQRERLAESYDVKNASKDRYIELFGQMTEEQIDNKINEVFMAEKKATYTAASGYDEDEKRVLTNQEIELLRAQADIYAELRDELERYKKALKDAASTTEAEIRAERERALERAQQAAFDRTNKYSDASDSMASKFQELSEIYKNSDEYKEQVEQKRTEQLKEALDYLKVIAKKTDEKGVVNTTDFTQKELYEADTKGALKATSKRTLLPQNGKYSAEDRRLLTEQYGDVQRDLLTEVKRYMDLGGQSSAGKTISEIKTLLENYSIENLSAVSDSEFYEKFSLYDSETKKIISQLKDWNAGGNAIAPERLKSLQESMKYFAHNIDLVKNELEIDTTGTSTTLDMLQGSKNDFVAFWKRLMSENTGLTTQNMTSPQAALNDYIKDIANRNIVSNVMKAALSTSGVASATSLLKVRDDFEAKTLRNSGFETYQVDWEKSAKAVKEFAMQLSASTEVVTAYREGLEQEADTLKNIIVSSTKYETADLKQNNKIVSVKTLSKIAENVSDSQLVNALGRELSYNGVKVDLEGDKLYTVIDGVKTEITEEMYKDLSINDGIYDIIADYLPKIQKEISETKMRERNNQELSDLVAKILPNELTKALMSSSNPERSSFFLGNSGYAVDQFYNAFDSVMQNLESTGIAPGLSGKSKEDVLMAWFDDKSIYHDQAVLVVEAILEAIRNSANELGTNGGAYSSLFGKSQTADRDTAMLERYNKLFGRYNGQISPNAWTDEGGYDLGSKLISDMFGVSKGYTMDDLYKQMENDLGSVTKSTIYWKEALEDVKDVMKSMAEETSALVGDLGKKSWLAPFEQWGAILVNGKKWTEETADAYKELGTEALNALGPIMAKAGFELVARGAIDNNWSLILGGLGLAATGGFASGLGGALSEAQDNSNDDEAAKIQDLKDQLADLLDQARKDALYYENNMRHKTAVGLNKEFSYQSVNDAIITPQGDVVKTDPKDYLIATKTPGQFASGATVTPIINCSVINNTGSQVRQEQRQNPDGSIDILTFIEDAVGNYIASSKSDEAFSAREYRVHGRQAIMG
jgi:tape measure domain-containing protein